MRIVARAGNKTSTQRIWLRISDQDGFCYVHLTNDKLEIVGNGRSVKASFGSSGSPTGFTCTLDRRFTFACKCFFGIIINSCSVLYELEYNMLIAWR